MPALPRIATTSEDRDQRAWLRVWVDVSDDPIEGHSEVDVVFRGDINTGRFRGGWIVPAGGDPDRQEHLVGVHGQTGLNPSDDDLKQAAMAAIAEFRAR